MIEFLNQDISYKRNDEFSLTSLVEWARCSYPGRFSKYLKSNHLVPASNTIPYHLDRFGALQVENR